MASMNEKDYYAVLEVDEGATTDEIRRAFQKKARTLHPDVNKEPDAEERFKEVSEAYAVLSDADKRKRYDAMRSGVPFGGGYGGPTPGGYGEGFPFDGFPFGGAWSGGGASRSRSYRPRAGADVSMVVELDAKTAKKGARRGVTYQRYASCDVCHGTGSVEHASPVTCPTCGGAGRMRVDLGGLGLFGIGFMEVTCPECEGSGKVVADPCTSCAGSGRVLTATELVVDIPENVHDGDEVRVEGMGNAGTNGREAGDFVCHIGVSEERLTSRQEGGFRLFGLGIPILILGIFGRGMSMSTVVIGVVMLVAGLVMVLSDKPRMNSRWWGQGGSAVGRGALAGIAVGILITLMYSGFFSFFFVFLLLMFLIPSLMAQRTR